MVLTPSGRIAASLNIAGSIATNGRDMRIPVHPKLRDILEFHHRATGPPSAGPVIKLQRGKQIPRPAR